MKREIKVSVFAVIILLFMVQTSDAQDEILFRKHIVYSGINGFFYGLAFDYIFGLEDGPAVGVPVISAGASALLPLITNSSKTITPNSLVLSGHGKLIGWVHGFGLATLIGGENAWSYNTNKLSVGLGAATSIGLGIVGNSLGKNTGWSEGRVALYRHYGWVGPFTGISLMATFSDEPRLYGGSVLMFGAAGYLLADKIYNKYNYTRGDIRATQVLALLNGGLGWGILADISERAEMNDIARADLFIPAIGILSGTIISHIWLKDLNLTPKQGMKTVYAAAGGAILGLGIALLTESENITPYYVIPYITGMGACAFAVESARKKNRIPEIFPETRKNNWEFTIMPQNLILNEKMTLKGFENSKFSGMQPLFAASLTF